MWSDSRWMRRDGGDFVCRVRFAGDQGGQAAEGDCCALVLLLCDETNSHKIFHAAFHS